MLMSRRVTKTNTPNIVRHERKLLVEPTLTELERSLLDAGESVGSTRALNWTYNGKSYNLSVTYRAHGREPEWVLLENSHGPLGLPVWTYTGGDIVMVFKMLPSNVRNDGSLDGDGLMVMTRAERERSRRTNTFAVDFNRNHRNHGENDGDKQQVSTELEWSKSWGAGQSTRKSAPVTGFGPKLIDRSLVESAKMSLRCQRTGLVSYQGFLLLLEQEFYRSQRTKEEFAVVVVGASNASDFARVIDIVNRVKRLTDIVASYGDNELVCLLPATPASGASVFAKRIGKLLMQAQTEHGIGIAKSKDHENIPLLLGAADYAKSMSS